MPIEEQRAKGPLKRSSPTSGGAVPRMAPALGIVKDNTDPTRSGKIMVYVVDNSGLDPDNKDSWKPVRFLSPFYGLTRPDAPKDGNGTYKGNPSSYGMWMSPPDIGSTVMCLFVDGDMNYGFYIGCVPEPDAMQMVPAIGSSDNIIANGGEAQSYGGATKLPVTNINSNNQGVSDNNDFLTSPKPIHSYSAAIMFQQGIIRDPIRGPITSSSQRETPSRVGWGISTPGRPIYDGGFDDTTVASNLTDANAKSLRVVARRGGHTIVMDDGDINGTDQLIRIRTALGHQILMSDDGQTLMLLHSNGQSYIELGKEGTVDVFSTNSVNIRTQGDLNLHADNNINIHAEKNINVHAGENIHVNSDKEFKQRVGTDYSHFTNGKYTTKVTNEMAFKSGKEASMFSDAISWINGSKVNLNSGSPATKPAEVPVIDKALHTDTLFDAQKGFLAAPAKLKSITSRAPAHTPWANACKGVDVKTDMTASGQLPPEPSPAVQSTNSQASNNLTNPVPAGVVASAPQVPAAGGTLNTQTTQALAATAASDAKTGTFSQATTTGSAIVPTSTGVQVGVGAAIPQTPEQLEQSGVIKPGSATLVNSVAASTGNIKAAMPSTVFTSSNLSSYTSSATAQATSMATNVQVAQTGLQNAGVITGKETPTQIAGLTYSAAQNGVSATVDAVKSASSSATSISGAASSVTGAVSSISGAASSVSGAASSISGAAVSGAANGAIKDIAKGNFAAGLANGAQGAVSGVMNAVGALKDKVAGAATSAMGAAAGAFSAIKNSMKPLQAGVPQNLKAIAGGAAAATSAAGLSSATNALSQASGSLGKVSSLMSQGDAGANQVLKAASGVTSVVSGNASLSSVGAIAGGAAALGVGGDIGAIGGSLNKVSSLMNQGDAGANKVLKAASGVTSALPDASSIASGVSNLPGGASAVSSVTNLASGSVPSLPGTGGLKNAMAGSATNAINNISTALPGAAAGLTSQLPTTSLTSLASAGLPAGAAAQLQNSIASIAAPGSGLKAPTVASNTTDRSSIAGATAGQLGDPSIPAPNFSERPPPAEIDTAEMKAKSKELDRLRNEWQTKLKAYNKHVEEFNKDFDSTKAKFDKVKTDEGLNVTEPLPDGHPLKAEANAQKDRLTADLNQVKDEKKDVDAAFDAYQSYLNNEFKPTSAAFREQVKKSRQGTAGGAIDDIIGDIFS